MNIDNNKTLRNALKVLLKEALLEMHAPSSDRNATKEDLDELLDQFGQELDKDSREFLVGMLKDGATLNHLTRAAYNLTSPKSQAAAERQFDSMSFR